MRQLILAFCFAMMIGATAAPAPLQSWSPEPWIADLSQAKQAFKTKYANIDWLQTDRGLSLASLFERAESRLRNVTSDSEAKAVFEALVNRVADGHVSIDWPRNFPPSSAVVQPQSADICRDMGFDASRGSLGIGPSLDGYRSLENDNPFPAGTLSVGKQTVAVIRIAVFEPNGSPSICVSALEALHISRDTPCDEQCQDAVLTWSYDRLTSALEEQVRALKASGATVLLVDIADNGGGSEWAEAAARIVSPRPLTSARRGFVRGPHWAAQWKGLGTQLQQFASSADPKDRSRLAKWAREADDARKDAEQVCIETGGCSIVGRAGYATGLVGSARAGEFSGKPWGDLIFSVAQFPYHDSVWSGPLIVLVDNETWSAAEEFAAVLQDNRAAVIVGSRTGGAGCGHTNGGTPTDFKNSGATLNLPDCIRFRSDGTNEVSGVIPDVLVGIRANDGQVFKARLVQARLPSAVELARKQVDVARR